MASHQSSVEVPSIVAALSVVATIVGAVALYPTVQRGLLMYLVVILVTLPVWGIVKWAGGRALRIKSIGDASTGVRVAVVAAIGFAVVAIAWIGLSVGQQRLGG
jgi:hypothetical protein